MSKESYIETDEYGTVRYYKKDTDKLHRTDGPAIEYADGSKMWYFNGNRHREDGPAIINPSGHSEWWVEGNPLTKEQWLNRNKESSDYQVGGDHYAKQDIQPWDYMEACMSEEEFKGYLRGNVIKYVSRYDKKGGIQDIDKALHYLEKLRSLL